MTTTAAVLIALIAGAAVAWFLYLFKQNAKTPWVLAFLRFTWFSLLVYALLSPSTSTQSTLKLAEPLTILLDSSASLIESYTEGLSDLETSLKARDIPYQTRNYSIEHIPESKQWIYVGDGHVKAVHQSDFPVAAILLEGITPRQRPLITGISIPSRVLAGSLVRVNILADKNCELKTRVQDEYYQGSSFDLRVPDRLGSLELTSFAITNGRSDTLFTTVEIIPFFTKILVVTDFPHPHEAMIRRYARSHSIAVETIKFNDISSADPHDGPIVAIGGGNNVWSLLEDTFTGALLTLGAWSPQQAPVNKAFFTSSFWPVNLKERINLRVRSTDTEFTVSTKRIDASGVHWYASALANEDAFFLFEGLLEKLISLNEPSRLQLTVPQRAFSGQRITVVTTVVNGEGRVAPSSFNGTVFMEGDQVELLTFTIENQSGTASFDVQNVGQLSIEVIAHSMGTEISASAKVQVEKLNIEEVTPRNITMLKDWARSGTVIVGAEDSSDLVSGFEIKESTVSYVKKNPQHAYLAYWGLVLLLALTEWFIRRKRGLV